MQNKEDVLLATPSDFDDMRAIWRMAFLDSDEYINSFLKMAYKDGSAVVSRVDGKVVSMAFLLDSQLIIGGRPYSTYYFYAAATHPDFREQGHMGQVVEAAISLAKSREKDFLVLVPAEEYLFNYYEKFGFRTGFYKRVAHFTRNDLYELAEEPDLKDAFSLNIFETRQTAFALYDFLNWGEDMLSYAMFEHNSCSGSVAFTSDGYAMYNMGKDTVYVKELCTLSDPGEVFTMLLMEDEAEKFTLNLPVDYPLHSFNESVEPVGMYLPLNEEARLAERKIKNAYIGITLG